MSRAWWGVRRGALALAAVAALRAHDPGISMAQGEVRADAIALTTGFAPADAEQFVPPDVRGGGRMTGEEFEKMRLHLEAVAPHVWEARAGGRRLAPRNPRVELLPGDNVSFFVEFPLPAEASSLTLRASQLGELPPGHREFVIVSDEQGMAVAKKLLRANDDTLEVPLAGASPGRIDGPAAGAKGAPAAGGPTFGGFVWLGMEHIWIGYDHLLFLFALLVVCQSFRSIVTIVTCFTLAHSLTLALATLELVRLPAWLVEPAIAASIVFVGVENLSRRDREPPGRWVLTFAFGLIHGFGFASVLRDLGVGGAGGEEIAMLLFAFNLGVEIGQIAIAAVVLPVVWRLRRNERFVRVGVPAVSALVALAGLYWLIERTVGR